MTLFVVRLIITVISAFIVMLLLDKLICSKKFNTWYVKQCRKTLCNLPDEQYKSIICWLKENIVESLDEETSAKDIIAYIPVNLRFKLKEKHIIALMHEIGYEYLSDCFLDPAYYSVKLKRNERF